MDAFPVTHPLLAYTALTVERLTSTAAGECLPCQDRSGETLASEDTETEAETEPALAYWEGILGIEGEMTGDGRLIEEGALRWEDLPIPIRIVSEDVGAHDGASTVGRILTIERREGGVIWGTGDFDLGGEAGIEANRVVSSEVMNGVSMDLDDVSFEIQVAADLIEEMEAMMDGDGEVEARQTTEGGERVVVAEIASDDEVMVTKDGRIRAATIVSIPAFARARITSVEEPALVAGGNFRRPPAEWFGNPGLTEPTPLTVTPEGRVYGHVATWGTCHISHTHQGCITPPRSKTNYAYFMTGSVLTEEGEEVSAGKITLGTGHASEALNVQATEAHYDNTGTVGADVAAGEDAIGIWVAGSVRSHLSEETVAELRGAPLSGDWRRVGGNLELVHTLAVNVGGFPIPRPSGRVNEGNVVALVASGMVAPEVTEGSPFSSRDLRYLQRLVEREKASDQEKGHELARRVKRADLAMTARKIKEMSK